MDYGYDIVFPDASFNDDGEFIFRLEKAMLVTLLEREKIDLNEYNNAFEILERKFRTR